MTRIVRITSADIDRAVRAAHDGLNANQGSTVSVRGDTLPSHGFLVGDGESEYVTRTVTYETLRQFIIKNLDKLSQANTFLGVWQTENEVYIDVSEWYADRDLAMKVAQERDELMIFDLSNNISLVVE